ncbi:MAG TPA: addiction module protein [Longimicrobiaceae bacterium]|nr:addiction module protein [Longimicrobiaceae bacterium]
MSRSLEKLTTEVMELPRPDRAHLAQKLIESLHDTTDEDSAEVERAWEEELGRRWAEIEAGTAKLVPGEVVFAMLRERLRR